MKYFLSGTWVNDSTINILPTGATLLSDTEWENRNSTPYVPTLVECKARQIAKINQSADNAFNEIKAGYPKSEIDTWSSQFSEATALALSSTAKTSMIDSIVLASGATKAAVQTKILEKAALYQTRAGEIIGKRQKLTAQIEALATDTNAKVEAIVW